MRKNADNNFITMLIRMLMPLLSTTGYTVMRYKINMDGEEPNAPSIFNFFFMFHHQNVLYNIFHGHLLTIQGR